MEEKLSALLTDISVGVREVKRRNAVICRYKMGASAYLQLQFCIWGRWSCSQPPTSDIPLKADKVTIWK